MKRRKGQQTQKVGKRPKGTCNDTTTQIRMSPGEPDGSMDVTQERANEPEHKLAEFTQLKKKKLKKRSGASGLAGQWKVSGEISKNVAKTLSDFGKHVHFLFSSFEL